MLLKPTVLALSLLSVNILAQSSPVLVVDINSPSSSNSSTTSPDPSKSAVVNAVNHNAQLLMLVEQLQQEVSSLRGQVERQAHEMKKMETNQRDRYRDLDRRIMAITQQVNQQPSVAVVPRTPQASSSLESEQTEPTKPANEEMVLPQPQQPTAFTVKPVTGETDKEAYDKAFKLVRAKSYDEAITAFSDFVRFYPSSSLTPGAIFWTAEVYRAMTPPNQEAAKLSYEQLISEYPQHPKTANAYYKLGLTHDALGNQAEAKKAMQKAIDLYPDRSVSQLARDYLSK